MKGEGLMKKKRTFILGGIITLLLVFAIYVSTVKHISIESADQKWKLICCQSEDYPEKLWEGFLVYQGVDDEKIDVVSIDINVDEYPQTVKIEASDYSPNIRYQIALGVGPQKVFNFLVFSKKPQKISGEIQWSIGGATKKTTVEYQGKE